MKVAIHQPQYLPWLPYFTKIEESDLFILLDSVDFQKKWPAEPESDQDTTGGELADCSRASATRSKDCQRCYRQ